MKTGYIYRITSPSNLVYIGQTTNLKARLGSYISGHKVERQPALYNSFQKHGTMSHTLEVIDEVQFEESERYVLDALEIKRIAEHDSHHNGLNCSDGGGGPLGMKQTPESNMKRRMAQLGKKKKPHTEETKAKLRAAKIGIKMGPPSEETRKKIGAIHRGKIVSEETKEKNRLAHLGNRHTEEAKKKVSDYQKGRPKPWKTKEANEARRQAKLTTLCIVP